MEISELVSVTKLRSPQGSSKKAQGFPAPPLQGWFRNGCELNMRYRFYLLSLLVFILDHWTKWIVRTQMDLDDRIEVIPDYLRISYVKNSGVAFGLFDANPSAWKPYLLAAMAVIAVIFIVVYSSRMPIDRTLLQVALAVTLGGILGNFADRLFHKYVVDFIELHFQDRFHWPTFNVADTAITIGIALLMLDILKNPEVQEKELA
jgi:signal peptidase II